MSSCPELKYSNVSAAAWLCCKNAVAQYVKIDGNQGQASANGVTVKWTYDPAAQTLSLQCLDKPFIVSCGYVNGKIDEAVKACLGK
jgi:hypothetical protein